MGYSMMLATKFFRSQRGSAAIEYGLVAALVAVAIAAALLTLGRGISNTMCSAVVALPGGIATTPLGQTSCSGQAMAACQAAGMAWDGTYCDTVASANAKAKALCQIGAATQGSYMYGTCGDDTTIVANYYNANNAAYGTLFSETECTGMGGIWTATGGAYNVGYCTLTGAANTATAGMCLTFGGGYDANGHCSLTAATASPYFINKYGSVASAYSGIQSSKISNNNMGQGVGIAVDAEGNEYFYAP